ncbi:hypothetical protein I2I05_11650 [Hymenobacter sp. BT683]|uniref:Arm DNA-binding domain-containing protein n=1 Tax=Hymenobacter jeongseonensis TaxID=2791027 RepID=A0ABS0II59_9BACT|nr:hypothetical protein [Hymenobacter jeongseonensis]MBF9238049.1 hypothetical protein [Hymenobacter jeongseonensis]
MSHTPTTAGTKLKADAHTKLLVYFKDGNARTWYSRSNASSYVPVNPRDLEIKRLKSMRRAATPKSTSPLSTTSTLERRRPE